MAGEPRRRVNTRAGFQSFANHNVRGLRRRQARELLAQNPFAAIFCLLFFFAYFVLYIWYDAIIKDARFVLSIFLPFVFAASMVVLALGREWTISVIGRRIRFDEIFAGLLLAFSLIDVLYNAPGVVR